MKKLYLAVVGALSVLSVSSCDDFLDAFPNDSIP